MTPKEKLIAICIFKSVLIWAHTGIGDYFLEEDKNDILRWSDETCEHICEQMRATVNNSTFFSGHEYNYHSFDGGLCPWCLFQNTEIGLYTTCNSCSYASRHSICDRRMPDSTYTNILRLFGFPISSIPGLREGIKKILNRD